MDVKLYFVRHGETLANARQVYHGRLDVDISPKGRAQAMEAADCLRGVDFDRVIVSGRKRTWQTAETICPDKGIWTVEPGFDEMDFGEWEGLSYREVRQRFPGTYASWSRDFMGTAPDGGESFSAMYDRVCRAFDRLKFRDGERVLVVGHQGPFQCLFSRFAGAPPEAVWHLKFIQGSYSLVALTDGYPVIEGLNMRHRAE